MSSHGEFSTMSSEEPSLPKSLPSSREATAEGSSGSAGGYMPLREFLDRFSLPRVVRLEGAGGRPVLLYKQQQRSLRVTATLLIHRYRHDVKVGPEIVIPEGYPDNTVSLVTQQSIYIARQTRLTCGESNIDKNVDFWSKDIWEKQLEENEVLVMNTSILIDAFCYGPIFLNTINLLTSDEYHRAVNNHPMRQLTRQFKNCPKDQPKVLALAAPSLDSNVNLAKVELPIKSLEIIFHAKVAAINSAIQVKNYGTPEHIIIEYNKYDIPYVGKQINDVINEIEDVLNVIVFKNSLKCIQSSEACGPKTVNKKLTSILRDIQEQFANSGVYGASKAVLLHLIQLECITNYTRGEGTTNVLGYFITELTKFRKLLEDEMKDVTDMEKIHKYSCDQVRKLFTVLKNFHINKCNDQKFSCIIFVQQQFTANVLYHVLKNLSTHDEEFKFLQSDFLAGFSNNPYKNSRESLCISKWNREVLVRFKNGLSNCIIATDVMEEGWFSVISGTNTAGSARVYRRVDSLVRAGVPAFLLAAPLRAYILTHSKMENGNLRAHYTKTTIRAGEILRLIAVFQDTRKCSTVSFGISGSSSEKDQYAQCLDPHGREVFAPLSARGEFYAICQNGSIDTGSDAVLYKVHHLAKRQLPLRVRLIAGPLPVPLPREYGGLMQLESSTRGPIVLGCIVPERPVHNPEMLELVVTGSGAPRVRRARLGYPSEARLLASPKMQRLLSACSRAVGDRATEPRVAPLKLLPAGENLKEMHLKKIKPKTETKPILQSLKDGLEHLKKSTVREKSQTRQNCRNGLLDRISKFAQGGRSRNPAKKSASFTFAVKPEVAMRCQERYSSLEPETTSHPSHSDFSKQPVQRSVSTSVLEMPANVELQPNYSHVRDSLTPVPSLPKLTRTKADDIYAEICENAAAAQVHKCPGSHVMARIKIVVKGRDSPAAPLPARIDNDRYVNSIVTNERIDSIISTENEVIYNTIF